jgi:hypothetical protein
MKIFVSYSSARRDVALRLKLALEAEGHDVFFDRDDLEAGAAYHQAIREGLAASELCIFLVSPESVAAGSYTLAELDQVERRWPRPSGHVLPVVVAPTPKNAIPPYLMAVTLLEPRGETVAETLAAVAALAALAAPRGGTVRRWVMTGVAAVVVLAAVAIVGYRQFEARRVFAAEQAKVGSAAGRALKLCSEGNPADAYAQLAELATRIVAPPAVRTAQEDCAMHWLRVARVTEGHTTFEQLVTPLRAVLAQALVAGAGGQRAGDLRAHLGWADHLVRIDGRNVSLDPAASYRQALQDDSPNVFGHAMWAHWLLLHPSDQPGQRDEALAHFDAALQSGRERPFVRTLQLGAMVTSESGAADALRVLDQMRQGGEALEADRRSRIWSHLYGRAYREDDARRLLAALPPEDGLKTFLWLFPQAPNATQRDLWRLVQGLLLTHAGQAAQARPDLLALQKELRTARSSGPLADTVNRLLAAR